MFAHVVGFELKYQLKSPIFWGTCTIYFLLAFGMVFSDDIRIGWGGQVYRNSPFAVGLVLQTMNIFSIFIMTAFVAGGVLRDDETGFGPIIQATRLSKFNYIFGRFSGGLATGCLAFCSVPLGMLAVALVPGVDPDTLGPIRAADYLYYYVLFCVPTLFLLAAAMFALATIARSIAAAYLGGLVVLAVYLLASGYLNRSEFGALSTLADPFGLSSFGWATRNFTAYDRNTVLVPFIGLVAASRAIWCLVGVGLLGLAWRSFTRKGFVARANGRAVKKVSVTSRSAVHATSVMPPPRPQRLGGSALAALTRFELLGVLQSPVFAVLIGIAFLNAIVGLWYASDDGFSTIFPMTRVMIQSLVAQFTIIPLFVAAFYAGELVWRDRERRFHEIVGSTPAPDWAFLIPKIFAVFVTLMGMGLAAIAAAISVQLLKGFTDIEFIRYVNWFFVPWLITMLHYAVLAIFVQTLVPHKFVGLLLMLVYYVAITMLPTVGFDDHLYLYATTPETPLSDMNGAGQFSATAYWYRAYWSAFAVILTILTYGLWRRGASSPLIVRLRELPSRLMGKPAATAGLALVITLSIGGYIFYNTHIINEYRSFGESERWQADYEKTLMPLEQSPQPSIVDITLKVDLRPHRATVKTIGSYVIENRTGAPLNQMLVQWPKGFETKNFTGTVATPDVQLKLLEVPGAIIAREFGAFHTRVYKFNVPLAPGERRTIRFETVRQQQGFRNSANETRIVDNGTFLDVSTLTPSLGISRWPLLLDRGTRRRYGLSPDLVTTALEDPNGRRFNYVRHDSDYVNTDITVTGPADQTIIATGNRVTRQVIAGRQIVRFKSEAPTLNFLSIQAAKYAVRSDRYKDITIDVFYHPPHIYNVDRMIRFAREGLAYYTKNFSPYQFKQFRIVEFPAYENFAQSFPGMVAYSEGAGFIIKVDETSGIDAIAYLTAHELAHQWWFHQLTGADQQGSTVLSETLAQYSAIMVMEKHYGEPMIRRFLQRGTEGYLMARGKENVAEPTLERVQEQAYVRYQKGGVAMYLLKDQLGEDRVNAALRSLLEKFAFKGAPYPGSRDLIAGLRAQARPHQQQLITDLFQKITLYDFKTLDAQVERRKDGRWALTMTIAAAKRYADGKGIEALAPLDAWIDIGVFSGDPDEATFGKNDVISLRKMRIKSGRRKITLIVDREPAFVGIDPYLKYIDRNTEDNVLRIANK